MDCFVATLLAMTRKAPASRRPAGSIRARVLICPPWQIKFVHSGCGKSARRANPLLIFRNRVKPRNQKYSAFAVGQISASTSAVPCPQEGRFAIVTDVGCGMRWTRQRQASKCEPDE